MKEKACTVVLSGGQDSTTCLGWAKNRYEELNAITFDYGQRHRIEIEAAKRIAEKAGVENHRILEVDSLSQLGGNTLTAEGEIALVEGGELPNTFVPGRNVLFLTLAAAWSYQLGVFDLVTGVCQTDYSGYPDCRDETIKATAKALSLGMDCEFHIHTPLMFLNKAESITLAQKENCLEWMALTHTCYEGAVPPCGKCPACELRAKGFAEAGVPDPLQSI